MSVGYAELLPATRFDAEASMDLDDAFDGLGFDVLHIAVDVQVAGASGTIRFLHSASPERDGYMPIPASGVALSSVGVTFLELRPFLRFVRWRVDVPVGSPTVQACVVAKGRACSTSRNVTYRDQIVERLVSGPRGHRDRNANIASACRRCGGGADSPFATPMVRSKWTADGSAIDVLTFHAASLKSAAIFGAMGAITRPGGDSGPTADGVAGTLMPIRSGRATWANTDASPGVEIFSALRSGKVRDVSLAGSFAAAKSDPAGGPQLLPAAPAGSTTRSPDVPTSAPYAPLFSAGSKGSVTHIYDPSTGPAFLPSSGVGIQETTCATSDFLIRGDAVGDLSTLDAEFKKFMINCGIPNLSIGVVSADGRLVMARGYTNCSVKILGVEDELMITQPLSRFRVMSVSKAITATAIIKLHEAGKLDMYNDTLKDLLPVLKDSDNEELNNAKVFDILNHISDLGWHQYDDRNNQLIEDDVNIANWDTTARGILPIHSDQIRRYAVAKGEFQRPSDAPPHTYIYCNFGYFMLGLVIEELGELSYEEFVSRYLLNPIGVSRMTLASTSVDDRLFDEVHYWTTDGSRTGNIDLDYRVSRAKVEGEYECVAPFAETVMSSRVDSDGLRACVEIPYGGYFNVENFDAFGGWLADVVDLCAFGREMRDPDAVSIISSFNLTIMKTDWTSALAYTWPVGEASYSWDAKYAEDFQSYGFGWFHQYDAGAVMAAGGKEGSKALLFVYPMDHFIATMRGVVVAVLYNRDVEADGLVTLLDEDAAYERWKESFKFLDAEYSSDLRDLYHEEFGDRFDGIVEDMDYSPSAFFERLLNDGGLFAAASFNWGSSSDNLWEKYNPDVASLSRKKTRDWPPGGILGR